MTAPSFRVGRFRCETLLAAGGATETYRARWDDPPPGAADERFALKLLRADRGGDQPEVAAAFLAAARRLRDLVVPGVLPVLEIGDKADEIFTVTKLLQGSDLSRLRAKAGTVLGAEVVARLGGHVADRLQGLHSLLPEPVIHGGLCPGNVLVTPAGDVVLLDCGLGASIRVLTDNVIDRWLFVAPELLWGGTPTPASDLYSLGAVLHFLISGRPPFSAETREDLQRLMAKGAPPLAGPAWLSAVVRKLLAFLPSARFATAAEVAEELRSGRLRAAPPPAGAPAPAPAHAAASPSAAPAPSPRAARAQSAAVAGRGPSRRPVVVGAVAVLVAVVGIKMLRRGGDERPRSGTVVTAAPPATSSPVAPPTATEQGPRPVPVRTSDGRLWPAPGMFRIVTQPPGATIWIDGVEKGSTPAEVKTEPGPHRLLLVLDGHIGYGQRTDTGPGAVLDRTLRRAPLPGPDAQVTLDVFCKSAGKYPVWIDEQDSGYVCPVRGLRVKPGRRLVGVFVIPDDKIYSTWHEVRADQPQPVRIELDH